ncbi:MAG: organomercurial lyase [Dehalococcoidia bacterium]
MDEALLGLRRLTYGMFVDLGRAPAAGDVADASGLTVAGVREGWRELHQEHALVLDESGSTIRMANPFSAVETPYRVFADGRWWFANCAWDAFGICAALDVEGEIRTVCPDCGERIEVSVREKQPSDRELLFHCLVPASRWWDDIVFT